MTLDDNKREFLNNLARQCHVSIRTYENHETMPFRTYEFSWHCVDVIHRKYALGILDKPSRIHTIIAYVERNKNGSWNWQLSLSLMGGEYVAGNEPTRIFALQAANNALVYYGILE